MTSSEQTNTRLENWVLVQLYVKSPLTGAELVKGSYGQLEGCKHIAQELAVQELITTFPEVITGSFDEYTTRNKYTIRDAGKKRVEALFPLPPPKVGDEIYIDSAGYIDHGEDDIRGGRVIVSKLYCEMSGGDPTIFVSVKECSGHHYNWTYLALLQEDLKERFGESRGRPDPDC